MSPPQENADYNIDFDVYGYGDSVASFNGPQPTIRQSNDVPSQTPVGVMTFVSATSTLVLAPDSGRLSVTFINPGAETLYLIPSNIPAVVGQGIPLPPNGQLTFQNADLVNWTCGWNAIAPSGQNNPLTILVV